MMEKGSAYLKNWHNRNDCSHLRMAADVGTAGLKTNQCTVIILCKDMHTMNVGQKNMEHERSSVDKREIATAA